MIEKLILEKYIPLLTGNVSYLEMDPTDINIFISTNGVGKSAVLRELNMLPPDNANYEKGGRKYAEKRYNGKHYVVESFTGKSTGHSFKVDGEEKNPNGTLTVQKQLCWDHFKLDYNLNRMLTGTKFIDLLSGMSTMKRKDIFMQMYPNDTDYALGVFNKLREERNNLKGAIKNQVTRFAEEKRKLESLESTSPEELELKVKHIDETLKNVFMVRGSLTGATADRTVWTQVAKMETLARSLLMDNLTLSLDTRQQLEFAMGEIDRILDYNNLKINTYETLITDIHNVLNSFGGKDQDPEVYKVKLNGLNEDLELTKKKAESLTSMLSSYPVLNDDEMDWTQYVNIFNDFKMYLNDVTVASRADLSGSVYQAMVVKRNQLVNDLSGYERTLSEANHKIKHYESSELIKCPQCTTEFKIGFTQEDINQTKEMVKSLKSRIQITQDEIQRLDQSIELDANWFNSMNRLYGFVRENQSVRILSKLVTEYDIGKVVSESLLNGSETLVELFNVNKRITELEYEKKVLESRVALLVRNNMGDLNKRLRFYENGLSYHVTGKRICIEKRSKYQCQLDAMDAFDINMGILKDMFENIKQTLVDNGRYDLLMSLDNIVNTLGERKERHVASIIRSRSLVSVVESIDVNLNRLRKRIKQVEILMDGLCPNKGLIGKLMTDFITTVCGNMNSFIQSIWCAPLYIKPCAKDNGDLNYKFPVINGDDADRVAPDLSDCSAGEQDMLNFAFRYIMWKYRGKESPLFMDEVGVFFDETHRNRFFKHIERLVAGGEIPQLFMISHYANQYGLFKDPNLIVINGDGLTINGEPNKRVKIR